MLGIPWRYFFSSPIAFSDSVPIPTVSANLEGRKHRQYMLPQWFPICNNTPTASIYFKEEVFFLIGSGILPSLSGVLVKVLCPLKPFRCWVLGLCLHFNVSLKPKEADKLHLLQDISMNYLPQGNIGVILKYVIHLDKRHLPVFSLHGDHLIYSIVFCPEHER